MLYEMETIYKSSFYLTKYNNDLFVLKYDQRPSEHMQEHIFQWKSCYLQMVGIERAPEQIHSRA